MGRIYEYGAAYTHEGYTVHQRPDGTWSDGGHDTDCRSNDTFRAACECGWHGPTVHFPNLAPEDRNKCWLPEVDDDRLMEEWERHMLPIVALAKVDEADERVRTSEAELRRAVEEARHAGATWEELGKALGVTPHTAQQRLQRRRDEATRNL